MAQQDDITIESSDDVLLRGDLYYPDDLEDDAPAVILYHMLNGSRRAYNPLIPGLLDAGYIVLNMDMRGHGGTRGAQDWELAEDDAQRTFDWLREQAHVNGDAVSIIGASIGSNMALKACANDSQCLTVIALSPGLDYRGVQPETALVGGLSQRSALLVAAHGDDYSADSVEQLFSNATGHVSARLFMGRAHGTQLFNRELDRVQHMIIDWLDEQVAAAE